MADFASHHFAARTRLLLTFSKEIPNSKAGSNIAAADLGLINLGVVTDGKQSLAVVGRGLRSLKQGQAKALAEISELQSRCNKGSRRWSKLQRAKQRLKRKAENRSRNHFHHAANQIVGFCQDQQVGTLIAGDIIEINRGKKKKRSRHLNQEMGRLEFGLLLGYLQYKLNHFGISIEEKSESYTTQTCPGCGHKHKPRGRLYRCTNPECKFQGVRDEVGAINLLNKHLNAGIIKPGFSIPQGNVKYLRPVKLKSFAERSSAADTGPSCSFGPASGSTGLARDGNIAHSAALATARIPLP